MYHADQLRPSLADGVAHGIGFEQSAPWSLDAAYLASAAPGDLGQALAEVAGHANEHPVARHYGVHERCLHARCARAGDGESDLVAREERAAQLLLHL